MEIIKFMNSIKKNWPAFLLPLSFSFGNLFKFLLFYLGLYYVENPIRWYGYIVSSVMFACFSGLVILDMLKKRSFSNKAVVILSGVFSFYIFAFGISFYKFGFTSTVLRYFEIFVVLCLPALFAGAYAGALRTEREFFSSMETLSIVVLPAAIIYFNGAIFNCSGFTDNRGLGVMNYMGVAYSFMPFLFVHIIQFTKDANWQVFNRAKKINPQIIRVIVIFIYWIDIIATGTRGCYICVAFFCIALVVAKIFKPREIKKASMISVSLIFLLLFNMFVYAPQGMAGVDRMKIFVNGLKNGQLTTSVNENEEIRKNIDEMVESDYHNDFSENGKEPLIRDRGTLYLVALKEFKEAPIFGHGMGSYSLKYGLYPHNAVLELLCETGIVGTLCVLLFIIYILFKLVYTCKENEEVVDLVLIFATYAVEANISGTFWNCSVLLCAIGYGVTLLYPQKKYV